MMMDEEKRVPVVSALTEDNDDDRRNIENILPPGPRHPVPWLMFRHGKKGRDQTFFNICELYKPYVKNKSLTKIHRHGRRFYQSPSSSSRRGWLIVSDHNYLDVIDCFMWNTVSSEKIQLPLMELKFSKYIIDAICSSPFPGNDPDSMVMFLIHHPGHQLLLYCHPRDKHWILHELDSTSTPESLVEFKGNIYIMCQDFRYIVIEIIKPGALWFVSHRSSFVIGRGASISSGCHVKYVQSGDELFMVCMYFHKRLRKEVIEDLKVFRMNFPLIEWKKVTCLGDHVLFLGTDSAASCSATDIGLKRGGYVFFTLEDDTSLYKFDLEKGTISLSLPIPSLRTLWCSQKWMIMPISRTTIKLPNNDENKKNSKEQEKNKIIINGEGEDEKMRTWVAVLDADIWPLITRNLNPVDYMHFRAVCKEFRSVAPLMKWRTSTNTSRFKETDTLSPWLVFLEQNDGIYNFIDSMHNKDKYLMNLSDLLLDAKIRFSKDGWLLMSKGKRSIFFFNPFTREIIRLPNIQQDYMFQGICFSSTPISGDCSVFAIAEGTSCSLEIFYIYQGDNSWTKFVFSSWDFTVSLNNPVFYNGAFYCLGCDGALAVFSVTNGSIEWKLQFKQKPCSLIYQSFLVECEGELLAVFLGHLGEWLKVFRFVRFPEDKRTWVQVESLGKHMLFISNTSCLSAVAPKSGMENRIYFPRFNGDKGIIYYSLDTCRYHSSESCHSLKDFYDTYEQLYCSWIEPKWSQDNTIDLSWY